jgi:hypothetical protein
MLPDSPISHVKKSNVTEKAAVAIGKNNDEDAGCV